MKLKISMFLFALGLSAAASSAEDQAGECRNYCRWEQRNCEANGGSADACRQEYIYCFMDCMHI